MLIRYDLRYLWAKYFLICCLFASKNPTTQSKLTKQNTFHRKVSLISPGVLKYYIYLLDNYTISFNL